MDRIKDLYLSNSQEETLLIAKSIAKLLQLSDIITLSGNLGSGKTQFAKGIISYLCRIPLDAITSPTFTYLNIYPYRDQNIYHFDLYRIQSQESFIKMGFDDYLYAKGICLIEWPEKIPALLPKHAKNISFLYKSENRRELSIKSCSYGSN